jgi:hypothetical protein
LFKKTFLQKKTTIHVSILSQISHELAEKYVKTKCYDNNKTSKLYIFILGKVGKTKNINLMFLIGNTFDIVQSNYVIRKPSRKIK